MTRFKPQNFTEPLLFGEYTGRFLQDVYSKNKEYVIDLILNDEGFYIIDEWHLNYDVFIAYTIHNKWSSHEIEDCSEIFIGYKLFPGKPDALVPLLVKAFDVCTEVVMKNYEKYKAHQRQQIDILSTSFRSFVSKTVASNSYSSHLSSMRDDSERQREDDLYAGDNFIDESPSYNDNLDMDQQSQEYLDKIDLDF